MPVRAWKSEVGECEELARFGSRDAKFGSFGKVSKYFRHFTGGLARRHV